MSQVEFSHFLGVTPGAVCNWEKGLRRPAERRMVVIAEKLGVPVELLLYGPASDAAANPTEVATTVVPTPPVLDQDDGTGSQIQERQFLKLVRRVERIEDHLAASRRR